MSRLSRRNHRKRNRQRRFRRGIVYAKDFGVLGDGHADDTDAMQRALDKARKELRLRAGSTIRITRALMVGSRGVRLCVPFSSSVILD
jgi:polygalacturonase